MKHVVNENAKWIFETLVGAISSTEGNIRGAASAFQNYGVELTDEDLMQFEQNLDNCWVNLKRITDSVKQNYKSALTSSGVSGLYALNNNYDVVNVTEAERLAGHKALTRKQLLDEVNYVLDFIKPLSEHSKSKLLTIKQNLVNQIISQNGV